MPISAAFPPDWRCRPALRQRTGGHRAGHADFALAADFGAGDGGVFFVQIPMAAAVSRKAHDAVIVGGNKAAVVMQHRRHDAGGAIGWRGDHGRRRRFLR